MIEEHVLSVTTTGSAGAATGNATTAGLPAGLLLALYIPAGMPATADWTFSYPTLSDIVLFTLTNFQSGWVVPKAPVYMAGAAVSNVGDYFPINREIKAAIASGDAATVALRFLIQRM